jgi:hypothetical protein
MVGGRLLRKASATGWLIAILLIGALVRFAPVIGSGFPVGDGGLFATMIEDIRAAGFALPMYTTYNGGDIPFAYPPLGLYLGAILPLDPLTTLQWVPAFLATACIVPLYFLARGTSSVAGGVAAALFYAAAPFGWFWLVQGGGLTRSLAMLLGLTAVLLAVERRAVLVGILGGFTALAHPETATFAAVACGAVLAIGRAWKLLVVAAGVSILVALPWLALVTARHGLEPFLSAAGARGVNPIAALLSITSNRPGMLDLAAAVGLIGIVASRLRWLWAATVGTALLLTTSIATHFAPLAAIGVGATAAQARLPRAVVGATAVLLLAGSAITIGNPEPLGADDREAMAWARTETPPDARFVVLSDETWSRSDEAEWFPHLTDRVSVATMQGREWLPDWQLLDGERQRLVGCQMRACVEAWLEEHDTQYVYLADSCCPRIAHLLGRELARFDSALLYVLPDSGVTQ